MKYNFKEDYKEHIFDTPAKMDQENAVASKIMCLLNNNKYDNIYDFAAKNPTYQDFLKKNNYENAIKHFGNTLTEQDYHEIVDELVKITEKKKSVSMENLKVTNIGDQQFITHVDQKSGNVTSIDNSHDINGMDAESAIKYHHELKSEKTTNANQNAVNAFNSLEKNSKQVLNFQYIKDINVDTLNNRQREILQVAKEYQINHGQPIKVDLDGELIQDEMNNIMKIEQKDDKFIVVGDNSEQKDSMEKEAEKKPITLQLTPNPDTIYRDKAA